MRNRHHHHRFFRFFRYFVIIVMTGLLIFSTNIAANVDTDADTNTRNKFIFSPRTLQWQAINENGDVVRTGHGSGGRNYCPDIKRPCHTPTGTFKVRGMRGADCRSSRYPVGKGGSRMPYCSFFTQYYAVHGSYEVPNYNASHGCVRIDPSEAKWLSKHFFHIGTTVVIKPY